jgi:hypothetical protein
MKSSGSKTWKLRATPSKRSSPGEPGEALRRCPLRQVENLALLGDSDQALEAEWAAEHVLEHAFATGEVVGTEPHGEVDREARVVATNAFWPKSPRC